jgi:putative tricarboxylic transport membrane protein
MIGLIVGSLPGLNDSITMAVLIPITFGMDPKLAFCLLIGIYCSSSTGGSIPAILLKIPGTASAMVTTLDGYPMSRKGKSGEALGIALFSSFFGGIASAIILLLLSPILAKQALKFGPPEYFMLSLLGMSTVIGMSGDSIAKNLISMSIGLFISMIGMSTQTGVSRFTFGNPYLLDGISLVPMLIGLFGITSVLELVESLNNKVDFDKLKIEYQKVKTTIPNKELRKRLLPTWIQSSLIGNIIGIIPGAGMVMAIFIAYDQAVKQNPNYEFGTGIPEGIAAPESSNNAVVASSMIPLLSLGVPGNSTSALFLGALTIQGLRTGPSLFSDYPDMAYLIILGFLVANLIILPMSLIYCNFFATGILRIKQEILSAIIIILCVTGAFSVNNSVFNIVIIIVFGIIGYFFNKYNIPMSSLILAAVLGKMMESNWIQSMVYADGSLKIFITRPISLILLLLTVAFMMIPVLKKLKTK